MSAPQVKLLVTEAAFEAALHVADGYKVRIAALDALLAEKQRQCDVLTDRLTAIDKLTRNCPCMSLQAQHEFERNAESEAYRVSLNQLILAIREQARL